MNPRRAGDTRHIRREAPEGPQPTQGHGDTPHIPARPEGLCGEPGHGTAALTWCTPPGRMYAACIRAPETRS